MNTKRRAIHLSRIFRSRIPFRKPGQTEYFSEFGELLEDPYSKNPPSIEWCCITISDFFGGSFDEAEKNNPSDLNYPCLNDWGD